MSGHEFEFDFAQSGSINQRDQASDIGPETVAEMEQLAARYPDKRSALGPILHLVQSIDGRVSARGVELAAEVTGLPLAQVTGFATFYTMYRREQTGRHHLGVCTTALCAVMGGDAILEQVERELGIEPEQTTPDGLFTLERLECNAACDFAPIMMVNWEFMDKMTPDKAKTLIADLRQGQPVQSSRGATITSWRDSERVIAGFSDGRADQGPSAGEPSLRGVAIAAQRGWTADSIVAPVKEAAS
jgi:NADH-quinone oxidoreductase subunit E